MIHVIKQKLDESAASVGLAKYNKSKFLGAKEWVQAGIGNDGRWITGIDENAIAINSIRDIDLKTKRKEEIKELRKELEDLTGYDLSARSPFWDEFYFNVVGQLNMANLIDRIKYHVLVSNNFVALTLSDIDDPEYYNAKFYLSNLEQETDEKTSKKRTKDEAVAKLFQLYDSLLKLKLVAKYLLGSIIADGMRTEDIYNELSDFIEQDKKGENFRRFTEAIVKLTEELAVAGLVEDACKDYFGIIRYRNGLYQRGNITYGKTKEEVIKFLSNQENAGEYISVKEELEEKRKFGS